MLTEKASLAAAEARFAADPAPALVRSETLQRDG
jgi:hypothetical protein